MSVIELCVIWSKFVLSSTCRCVLMAFGLKSWPELHGLVETWLHDFSSFDICPINIFPLASGGGKLSFCFSRFNHSNRKGA